MNAKQFPLAGAIVAMVLLLAGCPAKEVVCLVQDANLASIRYAAMRNYILEHHSVEIPEWPGDWPKRAPTLAASGEEFADDEWAVNFDPPPDWTTPGSQRIIAANSQTGFRWEGEVEVDLRQVRPGCTQPMIRVTEVSVAGVPSNE